jgi:ubiquinone biosynthesis protein COQ9
MTYQNSAYKKLQKKKRNAEILHTVIAFLMFASVMAIVVAVSAGVL